MMDSFEQRVARTIEQLQNESYQAMAARIVEHRTAWLDHALPGLPGYRQLGPKAVYELLFFTHMGLDPCDLPLVAESADEAAWLSRNPCTLLEACLALGLDTRQVCRPVNEKATQAFVSRINPQLRFHRSYEEIRPHAPHCREWIVRVDFERSMCLAIAEARLAAAAGHTACGAVVEYSGRVIGRGHDTGAGQHAVARAIGEAAAAMGGPDLCGVILYTTSEPCPACVSLALQANLTTIVYGATAPGRPTTKIDAGAPWALEVIGGVLADECCDLVQPTGG